MPWTNVQLLANSRDKTSGKYNNSLFNAVNQNLVQGQIHSVSVNEVNFPYDIPNVQQGVTDTFDLANSDTGVVLPITIPSGFYTAVELLAVLNAVIALEGAAAVPPIPAGDAPTFAYAASENLFTLVAPVNPPPGNPTPTWEIYSPYTFPAGYNQPPNTLGKDLLSIMGFLPIQAAGAQATVVSSDPAQQADTLRAAASAPLTFTQYIDICSPELCQFQYFRDGSTTNLARRSDVICRLYISNNIATLEEEGTRPFVINRQYKNARVMRWSSGSSVGSMSIQLFDDTGQPLRTIWEPRPYQISFNVYEQDKDSLTY